MKKSNGKPKEEINASSIQSPDDMNAIFRHKAGKNYKGYVFNLTETCEPENKVQLITKVQLAPNTAEDATFMREALPDLKERTGLEILYTDGAYTDKLSDKELRDHKVEQIQTSIRGTKHKSEGPHLSDFEITQNQDGEPIQIICPQGHETEVTPTAQRKGFLGNFEDEHCRQCPLMEQCPTYFVKRSGKWHIRLTQQNVNVAQRRRKHKKFKEEGRNLRAAVEATVRQVKYPYPMDKLPVRGLSRMTVMIIAAAAMVNVRRIQSMKDKTQDITAKNDGKTRGRFFFCFLAFSHKWPFDCLTPLYFGYFCSKLIM